MKIEKVLVHPIDDPQMRDICTVWMRWAQEPTTKVITDKDFDGLADMEFMSAVEGYLLIGGRGGGSCVTTLLSNLANLPEVKDKLVKVSISLEATLIAPQTLSYVISKIFLEQNVLIGIAR